MPLPASPTSASDYVDVLDGLTMGSEQVLYMEDHRTFEHYGISRGALRFEVLPVLGVKPDTRSSGPVEASKAVRRAPLAPTPVAR